MIGVDIVKIERIAQKIASETFLIGVFTKSEIEYYNQQGGKAETLAGLFAVKEAVSKALRTGFDGFKPIDVEVIHDDYGAPDVILHNKAKEFLSNRQIQISISHDGDYAVAMCIILNNN